MTYRDRVKGIRRIKARDLEPHPGNWRVHPDGQRVALARILARVGVAGTLLGYETPEGKVRLLDGHLRREDYPDQEWPVVILDITEEEASLILATHDPLAAMAEADEGMLRSLLASLQEEEALLAGQVLGELDVDLVSEEGREPPEPSDPGPDRAEELRAKWRTELGQLWRVPSQGAPGGEHRIICGDCTDPEIVARVMEEKEGDAVVSDPPYGVGVAYGSFEDRLGNVAELIERFWPNIQAFPVIAVTPGIPAMWFYPRPTWLLAWIHPATVSSGPWGFNGLNPILVYGKDPYLQKGYGRQTDHIVTGADRMGVDGHPAPKPVKVWEWLIKRVSPVPGAIIFDPFLGSGTTIVACERLGRLGRGVEVEPKYVAVALQRLADMGLEPVLDGGDA